MLNATDWAVCVFCVITAAYSNCVPIKQSPGEATGSSVVRVSWNPKDHHRVHNTSLLFLRFSQISRVQDIPLYLRFILILFSHLYLRLPTSLFPLGVSTKLLYTFLFSAIRATCPAHFIFFALLNVTHCVSSTNHKGPQCTVFSSNLLLFPLTPKYFLSTLSSNIPQLSFLS